MSASLRPHRGGTVIALAVLLALGGPSCRARSAEVEVEKNSPAVRDGRLVEDIGIEAIGAHFSAILNRNQSVPCQSTKSFSTATDNQDQIQIHMVRGTGASVADATRLGDFTLAQLPKLPRGEVRVLVTFAVSGDGAITMRAAESLGHPIVIRRESRN